MKNSFKKGDDRKNRMQRLREMSKNLYIFKILLTRAHNVIAFNKSDRNNIKINIHSTSNNLNKKIYEYAKYFICTNNILI